MTDDVDKLRIPGVLKGNWSLHKLIEMRDIAKAAFHEYEDKQLNAPTQVERNRAGVLAGFYFSSWVQLDGMIAKKRLGL